MNTIISQQEKELSVPSLLNYYYLNFKKIIAYSLIPILFGFIILFYTKPFHNEDFSMSMNIQIQDDSIIGVFSKTFFFSSENIKSALERTNLLHKVELNTEFVNSFDMISGHTDINMIIENYINRDTLSLTKQLYFKPELIEDLRKDLVTKGSGLGVIIYRSNNNLLSTNEVSILISNLVDVINENIAIEYDRIDLELKKIMPLEIGRPISSMDVNAINNRLSIVREYIQILNTSYASFAPNINLRVILSNLDSSEDLFNYVIQENALYRDIIEKRINLDVNAISKRLNALSSNFGEFATTSSNDIMANSNSESTINADSSFIDTILVLGERANNVEQRTELLNELSSLEFQKIRLERRLEDLNVKTNFDMPVDEARDYLVSSLNEITEDINKYIDSIKEVSQVAVPISKLSYAKKLSESYISYIFRYIIYLIIGSFAGAFLLFTISYIRTIAVNDHSIK